MIKIANPDRVETARASFRERFKAYFLLGDSNRNAALEGMRGYALLLVVYAHCLSNFLWFRGINVFRFDLSSILSSSAKGARSGPLMVFLANVHYVVDLFFVMSAFLMTRLMIKQQSQFSWTRYYRQRIARIYPPVLATMALAVIVKCFWLDKFPFDWLNLLENLLFLNGCPDDLFHTVEYNYPTWSLFPECCFYLTFPVLFILIQRAWQSSGDLAIGAMAVLSCAILLTHAGMPRACSFFFGIMLAMQDDESLVRLARRLPTGLVLAFYLALATVFSAGWPSWSWFSPLFGLAASMLIVKSCYDTGPLQRFFSNMVLRWVGNISFSLYLVHSTVIDVIEHWAQSKSWTLHPVLGAGLFLILASLASLAAAVVMFAVVERWYFRKAARPKIVQPEAREVAMRAAA